MYIIAFGASTSKESINKKFAHHVSSLFAYSTFELLDLNDYPLPLFSVDVEKEKGIPQNVIHFYDKIQTADLLVISLAEHNGTYTAAFKNLMDWLSRYVSKFFNQKKLLLLSTSTGKRGGKGVMDAALIRFPIHGADIMESFSFPSFNENFTSSGKIVDEELKNQLNLIIQKLTKQYEMADEQTKT
ncbi:MAG: NAD(P)H-dependent oxidoreductase [Saprospiraceae bacterium]